MESAARERLLEAMLVELAEKGYGAMTVEGALVRCDVSEVEFAAEFADVDACLFAAYDRLTERLVGKATERCDPGEEWPLRIRGGLEALLGELAAQPAMARVLARSFPAIRPEAYSRYMAFLEAFTPFFEEGRSCAGLATELPGQVEMLAVGAAEAIVFDEIAAGRAAQLPELGPAILFSVLVPFLGPEAASAEMQKAAQAS